jgi:hypothetical protein
MFDVADHPEADLLILMDGAFAHLQEGLTL